MQTPRAIDSRGWLIDKVALVTGAGSGIGRAVARRFVEEGALVVAFDLSEQRLEELQRELGQRVFPFCGDVRIGEDNRAAVDAAIEHFGALHVFVANAGIWDGKRRLTELAPAQLAQGFDEVFAINVKGYFFGAQAAIPALIQSQGSMIFTLSTSSFYVGGGGSIYIAAKHATLGLMRALAHELAPTVRVNGVAPAGTSTSMADAAALAKGSSGEDTRPPPGGPASNLLEVNVRPEDHTGAYVLLASDHSRLVTGTVIHSDGGRGVMAAQTVNLRGDRRN